MKPSLIPCLFSFVSLICTSYAESEMPKKWDLRIVDSANTLDDKITSYQKNFWFQDNYTLTSYMLNFSINSINSGVYFATERTSDSNNGIGVIVEEINTFSRIGIHESSSLKSDTLSISVGDNLRFAYNAISHKAYLFNTSTKDTVAITLLQDSDKYYFQSERKISNSSQGYSYADPNRGGGMDDKTSATYGDIYDMSSLADNEAAFLSFVQTLSITSIPEPTSALLSIYALAILAARRRRK